MKTVTITLNKDGTVIIDKFGFKGKACEAFRFVEDTLHVTNTKTTKKPDYYQAEVAQVQKVGQ